MIGMDVELCGNVGLAVVRLPVLHGFGDATPLGLCVSVGGTQGRPSCLRPTLGWGTQSRWVWLGSGK